MHLESKGICPLCKKENGCAVASGADASSCWCMQTKVPKELLEKIPQQDRGRSCVCQSCIEKYIQERRKTKS